ncbi:putative DNA-binding domain-containing protein [Luteimonas sp. SJ-92]|uniref:Putative DNA-binding domain-containing protein n=1 Tax=Luteimonas salinisoli TaxID=2752307 RepID=A0A853JBL6_9GAMM|nr:putative DNA-binding domain-containing protein [Luteimonas salinisoli]NZA26018.1 putative DNA-binding domain-containing protein [Luteimonas salinisoli]
MPDPFETLRAQQFALARHLRDPGRHPPPPDIEDRRLAVYRDLFHNNIRSLLSGNFPVIRRTLGEDDWRALVREFFARHRSRTPLFTEIGREFVRFLEGRAEQAVGDPPWLPELAHYEWVELGLQIAADELPPHDPVAADDAPAALLDGIPVVSPLAWALAYRWPVHRIGPQFRPLQPPEAPTLMLVRRDAAGEVRFSALSPLVYRLLEILGGNEAHSGSECLGQLAAEAGAPDAEPFLSEGAAMLERLHDEGTLLGVRRPA